MAENLREVIARRLQNSQASETVAPVPKPEKVEVEDEDFEDLDDEAEEVVAPKEKPKVEEKPTETPNDEEQKQMEAIFREIELLQNDGRFRGELLHQLVGINKSLSVISEGILNLIGTDVQK